VATDLTTTHDHPANVLIQLRDKVQPSRPHLCSGIERAARGLRTYETTHKVTFATLDNDTLTAVREAYDSWATSTTDAGRVSAIDDVLNGVRDLLGLGD